MRVAVAGDAFRIGTGPEISPGTWVKVEIVPEGESLLHDRHRALQRLHCEWAIGAVKVRTGPGVFYVGEATSLSLTGGRDGDEYTVTITVATVPDDLSYPSDGAFEVHQ